MLVAQCTGSAACDLPTGLPWYFGIAIAAVWLTVVVGAVTIGLRLLRSRRERRVPPSRAIERRSTEGGVEPW
jgi:hypothetical protein